MPRLIVIKGTDEGREFVLTGDSILVGRDATSKIRLNDTEVSRRHAELVRTPAGYRVRDVGSANGTFVNGQRITDMGLNPGDTLQIGQTALAYSPEANEVAPSDLAERISLITRQEENFASGIIKTISETEGSRLMAHPEQLRNAQALGVLYEAIQLISQTPDLTQLAERILELIFRVVQADRGCILLRSAQDELSSSAEAIPDSRTFEPMAMRHRIAARKDEKLPISRTIVDHVLGQRQGILLNDASGDERFGAAQSVARSGIREVICVPMKGRHQTLGVLYLDTNTPARTFVQAQSLTGKFTESHLQLAIAVAHQAALAVEETRYYQALVNAERLAAIGQTVAALAHDLKNILQNMRSGRDIMRMGLKDMDQVLLNQASRMLDRGHVRVENLVMNMLSYSKERVPSIEQVDLAALVKEVAESMLPRAKEIGVELKMARPETLPRVPCDNDAIHRALTNIASNAIDAANENEEHPKVVLGVQRDQMDESGCEWVVLWVKDNGPGIAADKIDSIFRPFVSTKGAKGTGLGLAVSRKILREHGGDIVVTSEVGKGSIFQLRLPMKSPLGAGDSSSTQTEMPVAPPE